MSTKKKTQKQSVNDSQAIVEAIQAAVESLREVLAAGEKVLSEAAKAQTAKEKPPKNLASQQDSKQAELTPGLHPVFKKPAQKAFQNLADSRKKAAKQAKTPAPKPAAKPAKPAATPTKAEPANGQAAKQPAKQVKRTSASVRLTSHELTLNIGAQPVRELAEADAKDLLNNPKIFWYRPIQFPDPKRYHVQPRVESARVVERKAAKFTRAPWTVSVTIAAIGDDKRCESWLAGVLAKNKGEQE